MGDKNRRLRYDFRVTLPGVTEDILFEYDGIQHFDGSRSFGGEPEKAFRDWIFRVQRDLKKNHYALDHGKHLVRISYKYPLLQLKQLVCETLDKIIVHQKVSKKSYLGVSCPGVYSKQQADSMEYIKLK